MLYSSAPELKSGALSEVEIAELKKMIDAKEIKYIDFNENAFEGVMAPIQPGCECFTCKNHTRGYINHLVQSDEMNWLILLTMYILTHLQIVTICTFTNNSSVLYAKLWRTTRLATSPICS